MHPYEREAKASHDRILKSYRAGGDVSQDKNLVTRAIRQHENAEHGGKHEPLHLAYGGKVSGSPGAGRLDQRARGGRTKGPSRINIVIATGKGGQDRPVPVPVPQGAPAMPPRPPPVPPGAGMPPPGAIPPGMGGMPPGAPPGMQRPMMASGGAAYPLKGDAGSGGGKARLEKMIAVRAHSRRKAGGRV